MQKGVIHVRFLATAGFFVAGAGRPRLRYPGGCCPGAGFHGLLCISVEQGLTATGTNDLITRAPTLVPLPPAAGYQGLPVLTAEFVSDPSCELLGNLTPSSGCKRKSSGGSVGTGVGWGRLPRPLAPLPRNPLPRRAPRLWPGLESPSVPAARTASSCHKGGSGDRAALSRRLRRAGPARPLGASLPVPGVSAAAVPSSAPKGQKPEPGLAMAEANRPGGRGAAICSPGGRSECA